MGELAVLARRARKLSDACDRWLTDPDNPGAYNLGPRSSEVKVVYEEDGPDGKPVRRTEWLDVLLRQLEGGGRHVLRGEWKIADPRTLISKAREDVLAVIREARAINAMLVDADRMKRFEECLAEVLQALEPDAAARLIAAVDRGLTRRGYAVAHPALAAEDAENIDGEGAGS